MFRQLCIESQLMVVVDQLKKSPDDLTKMERLYTESFKNIDPELNINYGALAYFHSRFIVAKIKNLIVQFQETGQFITTKQLRSFVDFHTESTRDTCLDDTRWDSNGQKLIKDIRRLAAKKTYQINDKSYPPPEEIIDSEQIASWKIINLYSRYFNQRCYSDLLENLVLLEYEDWLLYIRKFPNEVLINIANEEKYENRIDFTRVRNELPMRTMKRFCAKIFLEAEFKKRISLDRLQKTGNDFETLVGSYIGSYFGLAICGEKKRQALTALQRGIISLKDLLQMKLFIDDGLLQEHRNNLFDGKTKGFINMIDESIAALKKEFPTILNYHNETTEKVKRNSL